MRKPDEIYLMERVFPGAFIMKAPASSLYSVAPFASKYSTAAWFLANLEELQGCLI